MNSRDELTSLYNSLLEKDEAGGLASLVEYFVGEIVFFASFGLEDQVVTRLIPDNHISISIFTLDTGRPLNEAYSVWESTDERYNTHITSYYPNTQAIKKYINDNGPLSSYKLVGLRKERCHIRKVEPLSGALAGKKVWVVGLCVEQSNARKDLLTLEWDDIYQLYRYNPLLYWTFEETQAFIKQHNTCLLYTFPSPRDTNLPAR